MPEPNIVGFSKNYWTRGAAAPAPAQAPRANAGPSVIMRTEQFVSKGLKGLQAMMVTGKTRLAQFEQELAAAQARGNHANIEKYTRLITNLKKKSTEVSTANVAAKYAAKKQAKLSKKSVVRRKDDTAAGPDFENVDLKKLKGQKK
jgi:hypothetical protein